MQRRVSPLITFFFITLIAFGCSSISDKNWTKLIPENATFVVLPEQNLKLGNFPSKTYASYLDDLTPSALQQIAALDSVVSSQLSIKAMVLYPSTATESHLIWIAENPEGDVEKWASRFYQPFTQNNYSFKGLKIHKLFFNKSNVFVSQAGKWLVISESSLALENALRAYTSESQPLELETEPAPETLVVNIPHLDTWLGQFASVSNRPAVVDAFTGGKPVSLSFSSAFDSLRNNISLHGTMSLEADSHSVVIDALTFNDQPVTLDRYIASNSAAFALFRLPPVSIPVEPQENPTRLDSVLLSDLPLYQRMAATLDIPFAFEAFPESGLLTNGEYLFIRKLQNNNALESLLNELAERGLLSRVDDTYRVTSSVVAKLIGSELAPFREFYLDLSGDVVAIAKRKGLAESVEADRARRRVIYYDETYSSVRNSFPSSVSGFVWADSDEFLQFINPLMKAENVAGGILNRFDITSIYFNKSEDEVQVSINTYAKEGSSLPYEELWVMPLDNVDLSAKPILGDIAGSAADEVIFSTQDGQVLALATDGTIVTQATTNGLQPVGGPVLYDWYGNGEPVILLGAGSKIFAWNKTGRLLPNFPIELNEEISSPILVTDILRNSVPEIVAATQNRKIHVLNGRGQNVRGWPQNTNAVVHSQPVFSMIDDTWSLWAFSQNTLHSWLANGSTRPKYPQFINAQFSGSPVVYDNQVLGSAADGYLYSIGENPVFSDSLAAYLSEDEVKVKSLYVANNELTQASVKESVLLHDSTGFFREDLIITQSQNGSVFLYNTNGELRFTQSLGQPSSATYSPRIEDINSDDNMELLALAEFGRLYAWEVLTNERLYGLPTSGMKYPLVTDLNGDGQKELIAQTREGLRCWTINSTK